MSGQSSLVRAVQPGVELRGSVAASPSRRTRYPSLSPHGAAADLNVDRLDSWKEIAAFFRRHVRTVQRWERVEGLPVHRHVHPKSSSVYAFQHELVAWQDCRRLPPCPSVVSAVDSANSLSQLWCLSFD